MKQYTPGERLITAAPTLLPLIEAARSMFARLGDLGDLDPNREEDRRWESALLAAEKALGKE